MESVRPKEVAKLLWRVKGFGAPNPTLEQWMTPPEIAAEMAYLAAPRGRVVIDAGAGTGILGIAALIYGAEKVYFIEKDKNAIEVLKENLRNLEIPVDRYEIIAKDFLDPEVKVSADLTIMNPPFGSVKKGIDSLFIAVACKRSGEVYALLSLFSREYFENKYGAVLLKTFELPLRRVHWFHRRKVYYMRVGLFYIKCLA